MKLGMPILYEYNSLIDNVVLAKTLGYDFIELNLNFDYCRGELENSQIINYLKESKLEFTIHFFDEFDAAIYDEVVDAYIEILKKYLELSKDLNIKLLNIHLNEGPIVTISGNKNYLYEKEYDLYIKRLINNLNKIKKITDLYGIKLVLENVKTPKFIQETYNDLLKQGFMFNYDIGHDYTDNNYLFENLEMFISNIAEFHYHDALANKCHLALGVGDMNLKFFN